MRKVLLVCMMSVLLILTACGGSGNKEKNEAKGEENEAGIAVDKGLLSNTITLPLSFLAMGEEMTEEELADLREEIEANGAKDVTFNGDYITFTISKKEHKQMMDDMRAEIEASFAEYIDGEDFVSFRAIEANKDFSQIDVTIDVAAFEEAIFESFVLLGIGISSIMYQAFDGVAEDKLASVIHLIDSETNEIYETMEFPELLREMDE